MTASDIRRRVGEANGRRTDSPARRRRVRVLLLTGLVGFALTAVVLFAIGAIVPGLAAVTAGLVTVAAAGWQSRPANWTPEDHGESR